ncbi:glycoside hydrolase domain-containing protein [Nocardioides sp. SYSU DS0663]|uniref:glycoside hydrolase domain-containing protein n=1 Tax=Nocardioides sp. SYSU DS0663 TaxID=3416445 RepID=UPI003F4CAD51
MRRHTPRRLRTAPLRTAMAALLSSALLGTTVLAAAPTGASAAGAAERPTQGSVEKRRANTVVTPGDFTGFGFDQCLAPEQWKMNRWLNHSPYLAVGIYISGDSRACREQPNLTPRWIATQLRRGWRLLPITLGPQASCQPRFPRYGDDETINPRPGNNGRYYQARRQAVAEADEAVAAAKALGIVPGSALWYDLEGYDSGNTHCRESALAFVGAWTERLHELGYVSGVYSSAGSGIKDLDNARVNRPGTYTMPDYIWLARWDGVANTSSSYVREDGWRPHGRVKQYRGGHDETWGDVTINIDTNFLDVGRGSVAAPETHCDGVPVNRAKYLPLKPRTSSYTPPRGQVRALQCLLKEAGLYGGKLNGRYNARTVAAARSWQSARGLRVRDRWNRPSWMTLLTAGDRPVLKFGSAGPAVRRVQRALNAAEPDTKLRVSGVFDNRTDRAVRAWQSEVGFTVSGVVNPESWAALQAGKR